MSSRVRAARAIMPLAALAFLACGIGPDIPPINRLVVYQCGNAECTQLGARLNGLPPQTGMFMVGAWFKGVHDVHWSLRWAEDSVRADFTSVQDSSIVGAQLDGMSLTRPLVLTVHLAAGGTDSLTWDYR